MTIKFKKIIFNDKFPNGTTKEVEVTGRLNPKYKSKDHFFLKENGGFTYIINKDDVLEINGCQV